MKKFLLLSALVLIVSSVSVIKTTNASKCPELRVVFARGSGGGRWDSGGYISFKESLEEKLKTTNLDYEFIDLDYPAVGVGLEHLDVTLGAYISGGESYKFGESVKIGVNNLTKMINDECKTTKYVLGGYSQGAIVLMKTLSNVPPDKIIYAATFGDPKIYLPEGEGLLPAACRGENLSSYRMYVPDCQAHKGILGATIPYQPVGYEGKIGTWCNKRDILCSSKFSVSDHESYEKDGLYEDASRPIFAKITDFFKIPNHISSLHDTAFLIDATWSMDRLIDQYKAEAERLAKQTLDSGGRVALYSYYDLNDFDPAYKQLCDFESCNTIDIFKEKLNEIELGNGGDKNESLLSSAFHVMKTLKWKYGSTKSLVVLTDAGFHSPDHDGTTLSDVVKLSKSIDPVNIYIITNEENGSDYLELTSLTDGYVETDFDKLDLLTDHIISRTDALPKVEEGNPVSLPAVSIRKIVDNKSNVEIDYSTDGDFNIVFMNDELLGITNNNKLIINDIDKTVDNVITIVPVLNESRGKSVDIKIPKNVPGAPNTGGH